MAPGRGAGRVIGEPRAVQRELIERHQARASETKH